MEQVSILDNNHNNQHLRGESNDMPTKVLLLRNLTRGVNELDIEEHVQPFLRGQRPKIFLHSSTGHAFVEFPDEDCAIAAMNYFRDSNVGMKGSKVQANFSKRDSVTPMEEKVEAFKVVLASVSSLLFPVDIDLMHFLFSKYGVVEKIVTFSKSHTMYQALIQFATSEQAKEAIRQLNNRNIYDGCNNLQIQPSRLSVLTVKANNSKTWDYTVSSGDFGGRNVSGSSPYANGGVGLLNTPGNISGLSSGNYNQHMNNINGSINGNMNNHNLGVHNGMSNILNNNGLNNNGINNSLNNGINSMNNNGLNNGINSMNNNGMNNNGLNNNGLNNLSTHHHNGSINGIINGGQYGGQNGRSNAHTLYSMMEKLPKEMRDINIDNVNTHQTPVVICYNLSVSDTTVQKLFNLFSLYGTVNRIKILREKQDTALVQFADPLFASIAHSLLNNAPINGRELQISFSKNHEVKLPPQANNEQEEDIKRTKSFCPKDQRYGTLNTLPEMEKYVKGACRPTNTLFLANIGDECSEEDIRKLFSEYGVINKFQFKPPREGSKTQMAVIQLSTEVDAIRALMGLHNNILCNRMIKVAFSKTVLQ